MRIIKFLTCNLRGRHDWIDSHSKIGFKTCVRCRTRRRLEKPYVFQRDLPL